MPAKPLTVREQRFVDAYTGEAAGNGAQAAILAGYSARGAKVQAFRLLRKHLIRDLIVNRESVIANQVNNLEQQVETAVQAAIVGKILDAAGRRVLLSAMAEDADQHPIARLKAVDILNKMDGLYIQKHEHSGALTLLDMLAAQDQSPAVHEIFH